MLRLYLGLVWFERELFCCCQYALRCGVVCLVAGKPIGLHGWGSSCFASSLVGGLVGVIRCHGVSNDLTDLAAGEGSGQRRVQGLRGLMVALLWQALVLSSTPIVAQKLNWPAACSLEGRVNALTSRQRRGLELPRMWRTPESFTSC